MVFKITIQNILFLIVLHFVTKKRKKLINLLTKLNNIIKIFQFKLVYIYIGIKSFTYNYKET